MREAKTSTSHGLLLDSIDGKIIRQKVNRKSLQASPKAFRQESLYSLAAMSGILIGVSSTTFLMS